MSAVRYDDMAGHELEAALVSAPRHDPATASGRSRWSIQWRGRSAMR
jgi:hypothetical protein